MPAGARPGAVRVHAAGVNPAETHMRAGTYANLPPLPWTPGKDGASFATYNSDRVAEPQTVVRRWRQQMRVAATAAARAVETKPAAVGTLLHPSAMPTRLPLAPIAPHLLDKVGARVDDQLGHRHVRAVCCTRSAAAPPVQLDLHCSRHRTAHRTAYRALHIRAKAKAGQIVLVHGASGGVGIAVQLAVARLRVFATAGTEAGWRFVEQGADGSQPSAARVHGALRAAAAALRRQAPVTRGSSGGVDRLGDAGQQKSQCRPARAGPWGSSGSRTVDCRD